MTLDPDVRGKAAFFGIPPELLQAVKNAEGNLLRAVQCSLPTVQTLDKAEEVTCRSAVHAAFDFLRAQGLMGAFIEAWGAKWAPIGATNDPHGLNANWVKNVRNGVNA